MKEYEPKIKYWKMKDGNKILITKMQDSHLINTIRFIERNTKAKHTEMLEFYLNCREPQGEIAYMMFEQEQNFWIESEWEDLLPPVYYVLQEEAKKRKII